MALGLCIPGLGLAINTSDMNQQKDMLGEAKEYEIHAV